MAQVVARLLVVPLAMLMAGIGPAVHAAVGTAFLVNSTGDTDDGSCDETNCTLREAILAANADAMRDRIEFFIGSGVPTISVTTALPVLTHPILIDGKGDATRVRLDGSGAPADANGLEVSGGNSIVAHLVIGDFGNDGLLLDAAGGDTVLGCRIGTRGGHAPRDFIPNGHIGIEIRGGTEGTGGHVIGTTTGDGNVVSFNGSDGIAVIGSNGNVIEGNRVGTDAGGTFGSGNHGSGVVIIGGLSNVIGGTTPGARNLVSGNQVDGINITDNLSGTTTSGNVVQGNFIGTEVTGTAGIGNGRDGVHLQGFPVGNLIGGTTPAARNLISGNLGDGVQLAVSQLDTRDVVAGNYIGTDVTGSVPLPAVSNQGAGVHVDGGGHNVVGGSHPGAGNLISGNRGDGVLIENTFGPGQSPHATVVQANRIGVNAAGTAAVPNAIGIHITGAVDTTIGGTTSAARNVVSGNAVGMSLEVGGATIQGNFVGVGTDGKAKVPNQSDGLVVSGFDASIGGTRAGAGNVIAFNGPSIGGNGITVNNGSGFSIIGNSIYSNALLGIDLGDDGVTGNDQKDVDAGDNELQNFPVVLSAHANATTTHVIGKLTSASSASYVVELYDSPSCDGSKHGEGRTFLGSATVKTGRMGAGSFDVAFHRPVKGGSAISATATSPGGSTSEFSACRAVASGT